MRVNPNETVILAFRHGETFANTKSLLSGGNTDPAEAMLTPKGHDQARVLADKVADLGYEVKKIYSSDLQRAQDTAQAVADKMRIEIELDPQSREVLHGKWQMNHASVRVEPLARMFQNECNKIQIETTSAERGFDKFRFCKLHPFGTDEALMPEDTIINVADYLAEDSQIPETSYQLYRRMVSRVQHLAEKHVGECIAWSGHGAGLGMLFDASARADDEYLPNWFQNKEALMVDGKPIVRQATRLENCQLLEIRFNHDTKAISVEIKK